jgi:zinc/manganese transport system substrate-binding protein
MSGHVTRWFVGLASALVLAGCASAPGTSTGTGATADAKLKVVASTNVWASIATAVGGDDVTVTTILDDPSVDPHSFEAGPKVKLAMSEASLVIVNGGGYDDWALTTAESLDPVPNIINAVSASGLDTSGDFNEHVFYDLDAVAAVARTIATQLGVAAPANAKTFSENANSYAGELAVLKAQEVAVGAAHPATKVIATEPVPAYLIQTLGFTDLTPAGFSAAVEADAEVSVKDLDETKQLIASRTAQLLFNNLQTEGPVTDQLVATAQSAGVGIVDVTETLPAGAADYLSWMRSNLAAVKKALG